MWKQAFFSKDNPARRTALPYVIFGILWILFSDKLVEWLLEDPALITRAQTYKGWAFVLASGALIYFVAYKIIADLQKVKNTAREKEFMRKDILNRHVQPLWQTDVYGNCIFSNEKWHQTTGYVLKPNKPFPWIDIVHQDDKASCIEKFSRGIISKESFDLEYRLLFKDKTYHWVLNSCIPYFDPDGRFLGIMGFIFDHQEKKLLQQRYKESSKRYGYLFDSNPQPMFVYDTRDLRILEANKAAVNQYGYTEKEFFSLNLMDLRPASEAAAFLEHISDPLPDFHRSSGWIHKRKDGNIFQAEIIAHSLPSVKGNSTRLVVVNDISDQVRAFKTVKEGQRRFQLIFEYSPFGKVLLDSDFNVLQINNAATNILKITENSAGQQFSFYEFMDEEASAQLRKDFENLRQGRPVVGETNLIRLSGNFFRVQYSGVCFWEEGRQKYYISINDIDEKYLVQQALQESERINATLVSNLPGMAYRCMNDEAWTMIFVSQGVEALTGYKAGDLINNDKVSFEEIVHPEDRKRVREDATERLSEKKRFEYTYRILTKTNQIKWVWEQAQGVFDEKGNLLYIEGFILDITQRVEAEGLIKKQLEELGRINSELERFSYSVSHDLRSPLVTIKGFLGLLKEDLENEDTSEVFDNIQRIQSATDKMHQLLEDLLQLSRSGRSLNPYESFSMTQVAEEAKELLFGLLKDHPCELTIQQDMPEVKADKSRVRELYQNLMENAIKFSTNPGQPRIDIFCRQQNDRLVYCVKDNGVGIPKPYQDKIFGLFNKLDNTTPGTGLGLSLVKNIVENHGGQIWVESEGDNQGSVFCFTLNTEINSMEKQ